MSDSRCVSRRAALASAAFAVAAAAPCPSFAETVPPKTLLSTDEVEFLYIDSAEIAVGEQQNIVLSLKNYSAFDKVSLTILAGDSDQELSIPLSKVADGSMLFSFNVAGSGFYEILSLAFFSSDGSCLVDFSDVDSSYRGFSSVVAPVSAYAVDPRQSDAGEVSLQIYASDEDGSISEQDSFDSVVPLSRPLLRGRSNELVVALDPGHVGMRGGGGASANGLTEQDATWKIAQACRAELETYQGVRVFYTATPGDSLYPGSELKERVDRAVAQNADVLVSLHLNSTGTGSAHGAEVWAPYNSGYNSDTHAVGVELGNDILRQLEKLGLYNRGVKFRWIDGSDPKFEYPDGSKGDYYGIIRHARKSNLPAVIVEHAFLDNWGDYSKFLNDDAKLRDLGIADARGIADTFSLSRAAGTVYRLYYSPTYDHHYTMDANEYRVLGTRGWTQEGVAWYSSAKSTEIPVYRLYYPWTLDHHYTMDAHEYEVLGTRGWIQEGIAWYSDPNNAVPVYRLYHEGLKDHHYTKDLNEYKVLGQRGWKQEGIAWYSSK